MPLRLMFEQYILAFNGGNRAAYDRFYAPDLIFRNGAGLTLQGPQAVADHHRRLEGRLKRSVKVLGLAVAERSIAAALASEFTALADGVSVGATTLDADDRLSIQGIALYEVAGGRFSRIEATTLRRDIHRRDGL